MVGDVNRHGVSDAERTRHDRVETRIDELERSHGNGCITHVRYTWIVNVSSGTQSRLAPLSDTGDVKILLVRQ